MNRWRVGALIGAMIVLGAAHAYYWYWPRQRAGVPDPNSRAGRLLTAEGPGYRIWLGYPHQNISSALSVATGPVGKLLGIPESALPRFGPFDFPPSREAAMVMDSDGRRLTVVAEVYPVVAFLARIAGRLASNPWLSGGTWTDGPDQIEVSWTGRTWSVRRGAVWSKGAIEPPKEAAVAYLGFEQSGLLPNGLYRVYTSGPHLDIETVGWKTSTRHETRPGLSGVAALAAEVSRDGGEMRFDALLFFQWSEGALKGVPTCAVLHRGPGEPWDLPVQGILQMLGRDRETTLSDGTRIRASDGRALEQAEAVAAQVADVVGLDTPSPLTRFASVDFEASAEALDELGRIMDILPSRGRVDRAWSSIGELQEGLSAFAGMTVTVLSDSSSARLRFWGHDTASRASGGAVSD